MKQVRMLSTGSYLPGDPITNEEMERLVGPLPDDILEGIQVRTRHWMVDTATGDHREANSEMAYKAVKQALDLAGLEPREVDLLVLSTGSPDYLLPPEVTFVQEKLGLRRCAVLEIRSGCAGAAEGLDIARLYLERGVYRTAVVAGSETISPLLVPMFRGKEPEQVRMRDRLTLYNFGDGAAAMVLRAFDDGEGILGAAVACLGGEKKPGMQIFGGGTAEPLHKQQAKKQLVELKVDVVESGRFTPYVLTEALRDLCEAAGVKPESIDHCIIPEGNAGYMTEELREAGLLTAEWLALQDRILENLALVGATGSAALPLAVDYGWKTGRIKTGDRLMLLAIETSKWKYGGMVLPWTAPPCPRGAA
jgi:3-oxoacyl-[acyl-carrier-protein] synthase III